ncbi:MAG TPA: ChaN family lipoprotein [Azospirillum sp.]|nr:ChaN family lipoprotein [Azospirillum sp.]
MPIRLLSVLLLAGCAAAGPVTDAAPTNAALPSEACTVPGTWYDAGGRPAAAPALLRRAAGAPAVLLGERHDSAEHHRWQLQVLIGIHALNPDIAIGLEMLPRSRQPVLDRWTAGAIGEADLLRDTDWGALWGVDPQLYLPILHFARMNRVPLVALNVERALVSRTRREGWAAVPVPERGGVGDPAPPPAGYVDALAAILGMHDDARDDARDKEGSGERSDTPDGKRRGPERDSPEFHRFVEAQSVWDRAMAERIADTRRATGRTVVALVGYGHIEKRYGIPHQLDALGVPDAVVMLPWDGARRCAMFDGTLADAVFAMDPAQAKKEQAAPKPRLGVTLEPGKEGLRVARIVDGSIAAAAGIAAGDVLVGAAGVPVRTLADVSAVVQRQAPGTWLPITLTRNGRTRQIVAKFPPP